MAMLTLSSYSVFFMMVLVTKCYMMSISVALPMGKLEKGRTERDLNSVLSGEAMKESSLGALSSGQNPIWDNGLVEDQGRTKIFIITDLGQKGPLRDVLSPKARPLSQIWEADPASAEQIQIKERRQADEYIPAGRRDFDSESPTTPSTWSAEMHAGKSVQTLLAAVGMMKERFTSLQPTVSS